MEDNKNYERSEHLENTTDASMKDDDYFNASILTGSILLLRAHVKII